MTRSFTWLACAALIIIAAALPNASAQSSGQQYYVSPSGSNTGNGSISNPWDLRTALNSPAAVQPGDTIWLRGGKYNLGYNQSTIVRLRGSVDKPVVVRGYGEERATIDGTLHNEDNAWVTYRDFEIYHSYSKRVSTVSGPAPTDRPLRPAIAIYAPNITLVNLVIHDALSNGVYVSQIAPNAKIFGCIVHSNGWKGPVEGRAFSHGIYSKNNSGQNEYVDNVLFNGFGHGFHLYDETYDAVRNYLLEGNISFNSGINSGFFSRNMLAGGESGVVARNLTIKNNYLYFGPATTMEIFNLGFNAGSNSNVVTNNFFIGGRTKATSPHTSLQLSGNTIYGTLVDFTQSEFPANTYLANQPTQNFVGIRQQRHDSNRASIVIYNWQDSNEVTVNLPAGWFQSGDKFKLHNVPDYFNDVVSGTYDSGQPFKVSMQGRTTHTPIGWTAPASTFPRFGVFLLIRVPGSDSAPPGAPTDFRVN
jgi:hypothetical protein